MAHNSILTGLNQNGRSASCGYLFGQTFQNAFLKILCLSPNLAPKFSLMVKCLIQMQKVNIATFYVTDDDQLHQINKLFSRNKFSYQ